MRTFRFLDFSVYKEAKDLYREVYLDTKIWRRENWEIGDQIRRAVLSVSLNIAEGSAKRSDRDFNRYIENALGSINEFIAGIDIASDLKIVSLSKKESYFNKAEKIAKELGGFSKKLKSSG